MQRGGTMLLDELMQRGDYEPTTIRLNDLENDIFGSTARISPDLTGVPLQELADEQSTALSMPSKRTGPLWAVLPAYMIGSVQTTPSEYGVQRMVAPAGVSRFG